MKKIIMTTLLAATMVASQAQVSMSGKISQTLGDTKVGSTSSKSVQFQPTDNINFTATENLSRGLKARVVVETSLSGNSVTGGPETRLGDRQATVGLSSAMGSVDFGRNVHGQFLAVTNNDAFMTGFGSVAGDVTNLRGLRVSNGAFVALTPMKGVAVTLDRTNSELGQEATAYSVTGSAMGVNLVAARFTQGNETTNTFGANYKTKTGTKLFALHSIDKGRVPVAGTLIGVSQSFGAITAKASYGETDTDVKAYNIGLDYALSKRTEVGVAYRDVKLAGSNKDIRQVGVGITHRF
jgi:predicted porin